MVPAGKADVACVQQRLQLRGVRVAPELVVGGAIPRDGAGHLYAVGELVVSEVGEVRIVVQDEHEVPHTVLQYLAAGLIAQLARPVAVIVGCEILIGSLPAFTVKGQFYGILLKGQITHLFVGLLGIVVAEKMDAHQVKGVQQLFTCGVGGVMGIHELVVVNHHTGVGVGGDVVVAPFHGGGGIHIAEEGVDCLRDREVGAAERADQTVLGQRVLLLADAVLHHLRLAGRRRPLRGVVPVGVHPQVPVDSHGFADAFLEEEHAVGGAGRPVHHAVGLVGAVVEEVHTDLPGHHAHERGVFVLGHLAVEQDDDPVAGSLRAVLVGGVDEILHTLQRLPGDAEEVVVRADVVRVQRADAAGDDVAVLADAALEPAAHKAAVVFHFIALFLGQLWILFCRLRRADGAAVAVFDVRPGLFLILVLRVVAMIAHRDLQHGIIHRVAPPPCPR